MAWVCGLVAGVQPFAAEFENGTLNWLDALPITRRHLWRSKAIAAAGLVVAETLILWVLMLALNGRDPQSHLLTHPAIALLAALCGFSGGLFGSAVARTSMGAFGWGIVAEFVVGWLFAIFIGVFSVGAGPERRFVNDAFVLFVMGVSAVPLVISARRFSRLDRLRSAAQPVVTGHVSEWRAIAWLTWRQSRGVAYFVLGAGILAALILPQVSPYSWPGVGLLLGVVTGAGTFGADRHGGAYRFLGERRADPWRLWGVKHAVRFAPIALVVAIYYLVGGVRLVAMHLDSSLSLNSGGGSEKIQRLLTDYNFDLVIFGPLFGYALAQFFGFVCSKESIGAVIALLTAAGLWVAWSPSLVVGGVHWWQWIVPPIALLVATRVSTWDWLAGRLSTWRPIVGLTGTFLFAVAGAAGGIYYRTIEAPVREDPFDVAAFERNRPKPEENEAGRTIGQAIRQLKGHVKSVNAEFGIGEDGSANNSPWPETRAGDAVTVVEWPANDDSLNRWLDQVFDDKWLDELRAGVRSPLGRVTLGGDYPYYDWQLETTGFTAVTLLQARAVRSLARDDIAASLDDIDLSLSLIRHLQSNGNVFRFLSTSRGEANAAAILAACGVKAADRADLLRRAIDMLRTHEDQRPPLAEVVKWAYVNALNRTPTLPQDVKSDLYRESLRAPWEEDRTHSILATWFAGILRTSEMSLPDSLPRIEAAMPPSSSAAYWMLGDWIAPTVDPAAARQAGEYLFALIQTSYWWHEPGDMGPQVFASNARSVVTLRAAQYQLALIGFQAKTGHAAENVSQLTPDYLPSLPIDPFSNGPYHYRVSPGERILWSSIRNDEKAYREVAAGQGILWSVGPDLQDDGGQLNDAATWPNANRPLHSDIIFLIPRPH
jgi:hypothetical protein